MYLADYHLHSKYSFDGQEELTDICEEAIKKGLDEIAITDHYDFFTDKAFNRPPDCNKLYREIAQVQKKYEGKLIIRAGIEAGQPQASPKEYQGFLEKYPLDFIIGSIHNLEDAYDVGDYDFTKVDIKELFPKYLKELMKMAREYSFDVCGHITYPLRYVANQFGQYPDVSHYEEQVRELFSCLIQEGKGIEVNASGLFQPMQCTMPDMEMVKWYRECGGEILTIGCDAHRLMHIGYEVKRVQKMVKEAGFTHITTFEKRKPVFHRI